MSENVNLGPLEHLEHEKNNYNGTAVIFRHVWWSRKKSSKWQNRQKSLDVIFLGWAYQILVKIIRFHFVINFDPEVAEKRLTRRWKAYVP